MLLATCSTQNHQLGIQEEPGLIYLKNKNTKDAIPLFKEASNHKFAEKVALFNLARCYAIDKEYKLIEETCNLLKERNLDNPENIDEFKQQLLKPSIELAN